MNNNIDKIFDTTVNYFNSYNCISKINGYVSNVVKIENDTNNLLILRESVIKIL